MARSKEPSERKLARVRDEWEAKLLLHPGKKWVPERNMHRSRRWKGYKLQRSKHMLKKWTADPLHNVVGISIGYKKSHGRRTRKRCIVFYVIRKASPRQCGCNAHVIPEFIEGNVPTDVVEVGIPRAAALPGDSIGVTAHGNHRVTGTLGLYVRRGPQVFLLSNNHVIADEGRVPLATPIVSPGPNIAGVPTEVGRLSDFKPAAWADSNDVDCAIAEASPGTVPRNTIPEFGDIIGVASPQGNMTVVKKGQTTGFTRGMIYFNTNMSMVFNYPHTPMLLFSNLIGIFSLDLAPFAADGDSGAAIVDEATGNAVGLLIGVGDNGDGFATHMPAVMTALGVQLA